MLEYIFIESGLGSAVSSCQWAVLVKKLKRADADQKPGSAGQWAVLIEGRELRQYSKESVPLDNTVNQAVHLNHDSMLMTSIMLQFDTGD